MKPKLLTRIIAFIILEIFILTLNPPYAFSYLYNNNQKLIDIENTKTKDNYTKTDNNKAEKIIRNTNQRNLCQSVLMSYTKTNISKK